MKILVEEAGGRFTDFAGRPTIYNGRVLATNGRLHDAALRAPRRLARRAARRLDKRRGLSQNRASVHRLDRSSPPTHPPSEEDAFMSTISRRRFLGNAGLLGAGAVLAEGALRGARADKPINFSGWVFKPDTVKDYVNFYNQKHGGPGEVRGHPVGAVPPDHGDARLRGRDRGRHVLQSQQPRALVRERADPAGGRPARHGRAQEEDDAREPRQPQEQGRHASSSGCPTSRACSS